MRKLLVYVAAFSLPVIAACTVHQTDVPSVSGPSEAALSLRVTATPDIVPQDGASVSQIVVQAFNAGGQPLKDLSVRLDMALGSSVQDFGTLTPRTLLTDSTGKAVSLYQAPGGTSPGGAGTQVTIRANIIGSDVAGSSSSQSNANSYSQAIIRLTPVGVVTAPGQATSPTAVIASVNPSSPKVGQTVLFNGSTSCPAGLSGSSCASTTLTITGYDWDFGDGTAHGSGSTPTHVFSSPGPVAVKLVVTNSQGSVSAAAVSVVTVTVGGANPTAVFTTSVSGKDVTVNASTSTGTIVNYFWVWGDGTPAEGTTNPIMTHTYATSGNKTITLTVTDVNGNSAASNAGVLVP